MIFFHKSRRGFASMDPRVRSEIARLGGIAAHKNTGSSTRSSTRIHAAGHHENHTMLMLSGFVVLIFLAIPTLLIFGLYYLALDAFLLLLILFKLFSPGH